MLLTQKREILKQKIQQGEIKGFTIAGNLTTDAAIAYKNDDLINFFKKCGIEFGIDVYEELEYTDAGIYIPRNSKTVQFFTIRLKQNQNSLIIEAAEKLFYDIFDYYEVQLSPYVIEKILAFEELNLSNLLIHTCLQQKEIAEKCNVDYKFFNNLMNDKRDMSLETFKKIYNAFPLLPWELFLK